MTKRPDYKILKVFLHKDLGAHLIAKLIITIKRMEYLKIRSKKIETVIGERPPYFVRYGTIIISVILLTVVISIYCYIK